MATPKARIIKQLEDASPASLQIKVAQLIEAVNTLIEAVPHVETLEAAPTPAEENAMTAFSAQREAAQRQQDAINASVRAALAAQQADFEARLKAAQEVNQAQVNAAVAAALAAQNKGE